MLLERYIKITKSVELVEREGVEFSKDELEDFDRKCNRFKKKRILLCIAKLIVFV